MQAQSVQAYHGQRAAAGAERHGNQQKYARVYQADLSPGRYPLLAQFLDEMQGNHADDVSAQQRCRAAGERHQAHKRRPPRHGAAGRLGRRFLASCEAC